MPPTTLMRALPTRTVARSTLSSPRRYASGGHHGPQYNEPTGYLFGEKPPPPGQKRKREPWEMIWYVGMYGSLAVGAVLYYYKPDTTIQTWAMKEARARMEARGEKTDYP